jgi:hypothetical protein
MDITLYVILLEHNKYFLYPSIKAYNQNLFIEIELMYEFTRIHTPLNIIESIDIAYISEVNKYVKEYMFYKGISNVRGGSYSEVILPDYKLEALANELVYEKYDLQKKSELIHTIIHTFSRMSTETILLEKNKIEKYLKDYQNTKKNYDSYSNLVISNMNTIKVNTDILTHLNWLKDYLLTDFTDINIHGYSHCSQETKNQYIYTIGLLKALSTQFFKIFEDYSYIPKINLQNPEVVFDRFFFHIKYINNWKEEAKAALEVHKKFVFFYYKLLNHVDELEFDLTTFSADFEEEALLTLRYIEKIVHPSSL